MIDTGAAAAGQILTPEKQQLVLDTLRSVMSSPQFSKSKRYPALLEYVVRAALEGQSDSLKERIVGVEVFGRPADYDTDIDPVVRTAAAEVRRRTSMYFSEHPDAPVRIDLPSGGYKAEFHFRVPPEDVDIIREQPLQPSVDPASEPKQAGNGEVPSAGKGHLPAAPEAKLVPGKLSKTLRVVLPAIVLLMFAGLGLWGYWQVNERHNFWWPVLHNNQPALILVGRSDWDSVTARSQPGASASVALRDSVVSSQVCSIVTKYQNECKIAPSDSVSVDDIRGRPVVSIGGFNNQWTSRLLEPLRYQIKLSDMPPDLRNKDRIVVEHKATGDNPLGQIAPAGAPVQADYDYAIVARFHSDITDGMTVVAAGLGVQGTHIAGLYVTSPENLQEILSRAPKDWKGINFEAVLKVNLIQGSAGHVEVMATQFW
jgi:hypothetical protein